MDTLCNPIPSDPIRVLQLIHSWFEEIATIQSANYNISMTHMVVLLWFDANYQTNSNVGKGMNHVSFDSYRRCCNVLCCIVRQYSNNNIVRADCSCSLALIDGPDVKI